MSVAPDHSRPFPSRMSRNGPQKPPKTAIIVAQAIVSEIVNGGYEPGHMLPPERQMLLDYEVGRGTLREAMRFLEIQGIVSIKPGPGGGPFVTAPDSRHLASTLALQLQVNGTPFRSVVEARQVLEPALAAQAAERATPEHIAEIALTVENMGAELGNLRAFLIENERFHDVIAWSSGNPLFGMLLTSLHWITDGTALGVDYPEKRRKAVLIAHREIYEAIAAHDGDRAQATMNRHVGEFARYLEANYPALMDQSIPWKDVMG